MTTVDALGFDRLKLAQESRAAASAHAGFAGSGSLRVVADGTEHVDHGSDHRRKRTELSMTFDDLEALRSADLDEILRSL